jgi:hypothetical protein
MPKGNLLFECNITLDRQSQSKLKVHDNRQTFLFSVYEMFSKSIQPELNQQEQNDALQKTLYPMI